MSAFWALVVITYINGTAVDIDVLHSATAEHNTKPFCEEQAVKLLESVTKDAPANIQLVAKCVDVESLPVTSSHFGMKPPATSL